MINKIKVFLIKLFHVKPKEPPYPGYISKLFLYSNGFYKYVFYFDSGHEVVIKQGYSKPGAVLDLHPSTEIIRLETKNISLICDKGVFIDPEKEKRAHRILIKQGVIEDNGKI